MVLLVQELPHGGALTVASFDNVMEGAGVAAEQAHETLAGVRGQLNARR